MSVESMRWKFCMRWKEKNRSRKERIRGSLTPYFSTATSRGLVEVAENLANTYILVLILECVGKREDVKWDVERTEYCKREREDIN